MILLRYFEGKRSGTFVDVGAHHPYRFSNTYLFYRRGWRGINIDAMPGSMKAFRRHRPEDINIESAVGLEASVATYFMFNEPALNTFDENLATERQHPPWQMIGTEQLRVKPLATILAEAIPSTNEIDFLSIDVEGKDFDVLRSNDWDRFRPTIVLVEVHAREIDSAAATPSITFLKSLQYKMIAKTFNTVFMGNMSALPR
ncbi:MAG TPA: FkbM family methyltransferase [Steroidobacteraceae bacterium]|nr:FkbM family methyltransferase [Steroidobacteraceae bacterium]